MELNKDSGDCGKIIIRALVAKYECQGLGTNDVNDGILLLPSCPLYENNHPHSRKYPQVLSHSFKNYNCPLFRHTSYQINTHFSQHV